MNKDNNYIDFWNDRKIIAIDPGTNGGISVYSINKDKVILSIKMPETPTDLLKLLGYFQMNSICYLEKVGGLPGMSGSGMFTFGKGFGHLEMALIARKIPTVEVTPQKWMKGLQLGTKGNKSNTEWKNKLKHKAQMLFPYLKITLSISDSLLILEYARLIEKK